MPCTAHTPRVPASTVNSSVVSAASARRNRPPRNRSISHGARAIIHADTSNPTLNSRDTDRPTEAEKSYTLPL